ncbi:MAG: tetratricopeptide repeat protein [Polyangiaceae bacterium]|nr:tetratricopeptide repeat protein [Polyangiaceae bacterium]
MVKVECHGCSAPYQVDERRIPPAGLKMRCPKCGASLLVQKPGHEGAAPPPAPPQPPAFAPQPPAPPRGGDFGGIDLPAPVAPRPPGGPPPRPGRPAPPGGGAGAGGFGEIDLMVDLPNPDSAAGEVGLPVVPTRQAPPAFDPGGVDLPAARGPAPGGGFGGGGGGGFGVLDFGGEADLGGVDLPAARAAAPPPRAPDPGGFGEVDLPAARPAAPGGFGAFPPPPPGGFGGGGPHRDHAGLPTVAGGGAGLPAYAGGAGAHLPATSSAGLPSAAGMGSAGLPALHGGAGLPLPAGDLPVVGSAGLPAASGGGLPAISGGGLPSPAFGQLPSPAFGSLPTAASHAGLPVVGAAGLPTSAGAGLPSPGGPGLPMAGGPGLPMPGGIGLPGSLDAFPAVAGPGLPALPGAGLPANVGSEASLGFDLPSGGGGGGGSLDLAGGIGGEVELDGARPGGGALPARKKDRFIGETDDKPSSGGRIIKFVAIGMVGVVVGGFALGLIPSVGFFGLNLIDDMLAGDRSESMGQLRQQAQEAFDADTLGGANTAADRAREAASKNERHPDTVGYSAFVLYMRSIRFGRDGGAESAAKTMLEKIDRTGATPSLLLASAAEDVLAGQLARARQTVQQVASQTPNDVDAAVLAGEIELVAKEPNNAITAFTKAVATHKSARTLFGLARAQMAAGKTAEAEATAKSVLEVSKEHVAARTLLASIAASTPSRENEALELLNAVTKDENIRKAASQGELVDAYIQLGRVQLLASRMSQAQEAYNEALKLNPQAVPALVGSGELFYRAGRFSEAEARFESALRSDADNIDAKIGTAKTWVALERQKEAKELLSKLQTTHPNDPRVFYWLARVDDAAGKKKDAEGLYREAIKRATTPDTGVPPYVALSQLLASVGKSDEASKVLAEAGEKYPNSADLAKARGDVALQMGKLDEAQVQYEAAKKIAPEDLSIRFALGVTFRKARNFSEALAIFEYIHGVDQNYPGLATERGLYYEETGQTAEAIQMYQQALQKAPDDVDLKLRIGSTLVVAGQAKQAEPILKDVVRERNNSAEANHFYGRALLLTNSNLNEAIRHLKKAVELDGNRAEYHLYVGWAANEAGQPAVAEQALAKAIELDATLGDAYWQLGTLHSKQGRLVDAIKELQTALDKKPSRIEAHAALGVAYEQQNNTKLAEESFRKAIKGNDKVPEWHYNLGKLLSNRNDVKGATPELEKALELAADKNPAPGWATNAHFILGKAYETGDKAKAVTHYSEFLRLAPPDHAYRKEAEQAIERLKS